VCTRWNRSLSANEGYSSPKITTFVTAGRFNKPTITNAVLDRIDAVVTSVRLGASRSVRESDRNTETELSQGGHAAIQRGRGKLEGQGEDKIWNGGTKTLGEKRADSAE
jgi:hypothetical protein